MMWSKLVLRQLVTLMSVDDDSVCDDEEDDNNEEKEYLVNTGAVTACRTDKCGWR